MIRSQDRGYIAVESVHIMGGLSCISLTSDEHNLRGLSHAGNNAGPGAHLDHKSGGLMVNSR